MRITNKITFVCRLTYIYIIIKKIAISQISKPYLTLIINEYLYFFTLFFCRNYQ